MDSEVTISLRADRLRFAREGRGISQRELSKICGIAQNLISRYESGLTDPSASTLARIAYELNVSTDYLLGLSDTPVNQAMETLSPDKRKLLEAYELGDHAALLELIAARIRSSAKPEHD